MHGVMANVFELGRGAPLPEGDLPPISNIFVDHFRQRPTAIAVEGAEESLTYSALDAWSAVIASRLVELGAAPGARVAFDSSPPMVAGARRSSGRGRPTSPSASWSPVSTSTSRPTRPSSFGGALRRVTPGHGGA